MRCDAEPLVGGIVGAEQADGAVDGEALDGLASAPGLALQQVVGENHRTLEVDQRIVDAGLQRHRHEDAVGESHRSEEHTSELQSLMRKSYADFCLTKKKSQRIPPKQD